MVVIQIIDLLFYLDLLFQNVQLRFSLVIVTIVLLICNQSILEQVEYVHVSRYVTFISNWVCCASDTHHGGKT